MRLIDIRQVCWQNRADFLAMSARLMRRILVDNARRKRGEKHGQGRVRIDLNLAGLATPERADDLIALDEAIERTPTDW